MVVSQEHKQEQLNVESITWGGLTWLNIVPPTEREIEYLAKNYPFHSLDLDDCLSRQQRPKLDVYQDYLFLIFHFTVWDKKARVSTHSQVSVFIGDKYLITLHSGELKALVKLFHDCQTDEVVRQENFSHGSGYLLYQLLDRTVDSYFPILDAILRWEEDVEGTVFDESIEAAQEVATLRRDIITQKRIMFSSRAVIAELESKLKRFTDIEMSVYFGDLIDHLNKICETLDECKEIIEVFKDSDYVLSTDRLNRIIRVLTIFSAIVLPFLVTSSIYGMNIPLPGGVEKGSLQSLLILLAVMSLISGGMLYFFRHRRWI